MLLAVFLCLPLAPSLAQGSLTLIDLRHRQAEEIIPILEPHLDEGEGLSGSGNRLVLRASPERATELRQLIRQLDTEQRQLRISVRRGRLESSQRGELSGGAEVELEEGGSAVDAQLRILETAEKRRDRHTQSLLALEGTPVYIREGVAFPVATRRQVVTPEGLVVTDRVEYMDTFTGFHALARVQGDEAVVRISPSRERLSPEGGGRIEQEALVTEVRGPLGSWLAIAETGARQREAGRGLRHRTRIRASDGQALWIKVELAQ